MAHVAVANPPPPPPPSPSTYPHILAMMREVLLRALTPKPNSIVSLRDITSRVFPRTSDVVDVAVDAAVHQAFPQVYSKCHDGEGKIFYYGLSFKNSELTTSLQQQQQQPTDAPRSLQQPHASVMQQQPHTPLQMQHMSNGNFPF